MSRSVAACPHCATPDEQPLVCDRCGWRWYANPKPAAAVLLERDAGGPDPEILLLRRAVEPGFGAWDLPAGYLDPGESFEAAARRETLEEAGIEVELVGLAGVYHSPEANAVTVVYRARAAAEAPTVRIDFESSEHALGGTLGRRRVAGAHGLPIDGLGRRRLGGRQARRPAVGRSLRLRYTLARPSDRQETDARFPRHGGRHRRRRPDRLRAPRSGSHPDRRLDPTLASA